MIKVLDMSSKDFKLDKCYQLNYGMIPITCDPSRIINMLPCLLDSEPTLPQVKRISCDRCGATKVENTICEWCGM